MNKTELSAEIARRAGISRRDAEAAVVSMSEIICEKLSQGEKVQIVGFGGFEAKERAARTARNPRTGEEITIEASKAVSFKAGKALKDQVNA